MDDEPARAVLEILREAERVLDHQIRSLEELDDKIEQMLALGVGSLAGAFALAAFIASREPRWAGYAAALASGALWNCAAVFYFARGYGIVDREVQAKVGPSTGWLAAQAQGPSPNLVEHGRLVVAVLHNSFEDNDETATFIAQQSRKGVRWLAAALMLYGAVVVLFLVLDRGQAIKP
ncbi:MAG: hypothetical protein QOE90_1825 [Thermoplasmata archaeon]|nr:hypothetical protein [Thermoplasmata archaeon]